MSTGRGFATTRAPFASLYARYALTSFYFGTTLILLVLYSTFTMWTPIITYFWFIAIALLICPSLYNPHQFAWIEFYIDYQKYLGWMFNCNGGDSEHSWYWFTKESRSRITGVKRNVRGELARDKARVRPSKKNLFMTKILFDLMQLFLIGTSYLSANAQFEIRGAQPSHAFLRLAVFSVLPIAANFAILVALLPVTLIFGPLFTAIIPLYTTIISGLAHIISILVYVVCFEAFWFAQNWDGPSTLIGVICMSQVQKVLFRIISSLLSKELPHGRVNKAWWSGKWINAKLGLLIVTQPFRELIIKTMESCYFVADIILGHGILYAQLPILMIPFIDVWHTFMLFWLKPSDQLRPRLLSKAQRNWRKFHIKLLIVLFGMSALFFAAIFSVPSVVGYLELDLEEWVPEFLEPLLQPYQAIDSRKGLRKGYTTRHY